MQSALKATCFDKLQTLSYSEVGQSQQNPHEQDWLW